MKKEILASAKGRNLVFCLTLFLAEVLLTMIYGFLKGPLMTFLVWSVVFGLAAASYFIFEQNNQSANSDLVLIRTPYFSVKRSLFVRLFKLIKHFLVGFVAVCLLSAILGGVKGYFFSALPVHSSEGRVGK